MQNRMVQVVSVSIIQDNKVLMVKEGKLSAKDQWNFPSGRIEYGEDILVAACRECKEETGLDVQLTSTTGVYNFESSTNHQVFLFHFTGEVAGGLLNIGTDEEIIDTRWVKISDLENIENQELREASVIRQITNNLLNHNFYPLTVFNQPLMPVSC